jgi:hypothetical protein
MTIRRNFLQGLAAGAAAASMTPRSALAVADTSIRRARGSVKNLEAYVIACEENEILKDNCILDYWTFNLSDIDETRLPEGCRKVVISSDLISAASAAQDIAEIYQSIPKYFDFDPLESPNHCALHVDGVTDFQEQMRSVLATKSKRVAKAKIALVSEDSCCPFSSDWSRILPMLRTYYDRIISISDVGFDEDSEVYDAEFEAYKKRRHEQIAAHCEISVRLPLPDYFADEFDDEHTTDLICETVDSILRRTSAEISALPSCGDIPFQDWMAIVA